MSQAEHDKQEYEALRKVYEDEAAARARGEDVPSRPIVVPEVPPVKLQQGKSHKRKAKPEPPTAATATADLSETMVQTASHDENTTPIDSTPNIPSDTPNVLDDSHGHLDHSMDEFPGFPDLTDDMGLGGFHDVSTAGHHGDQDWNELHTIVGKEEIPSEPAELAELAEPAEPAESEEPAGSVEPASDEVADVPTDASEPVAAGIEEEVSEAPALEEAEAITEAQEVPMPVETIEEVREVATAAEGELAVPKDLPIEAESTPVDEPEPTMEASTMDTAMMDTSVPAPLAEDSIIPSETAIEEPTVEPSSDPAPVTTPPPDPTLGNDSEKAFESAALMGEVVPEAVPDEAPVPKTTEEVQFSEIAEEETPAATSNEE